MSTTTAMVATTELLSGSVFPAPGGRTTIVHSSDRPSRAVIATLATGSHRLLMAQSAPSLQAYARRYGWDVVLSSEQLDDRRPPSWFKVRLVQELLARYDYVLWVDADAVVVDLDRNLLAEVLPGNDIWFARHPQERDEQAQVLNAGVFLARSTPRTRALLDAIWSSEAFIDHNWWENAALLDLLGYSLEPPYEQLERTHWNDGIGTLPLDWNSVPGYCESPTPVINHHARSDHGDFERRLEDSARDRRTVVARHPDDFAGQWTNSTAPIERRPTRTHEFVGLAHPTEPTVAELVRLLERLDGVNEDQRLRLMQVLDWFESAVDREVAAELDAERWRGELEGTQAQLADARHALEDASARAEELARRLVDEPRPAPPRLAGHLLRRALRRVRSSHA